MKLSTLLLAFIILFLMCSSSLKNYNEKSNPNSITSKLAIGKAKYLNECAEVNKMNITRTIMTKLASWRELHTQYLSKNTLTTCTLWIQFRVDQTGQTESINIDSLSGYRDDEFLNALTKMIMLMKWDYIDKNCSPNFSYYLRFEKNL